MFCTKCGNELEDGILFCSKCGNMISMSELPQENDSNVDTQNNLNESVNVNSNVNAGVDTAPIADADTGTGLNAGADIYSNADVQPEPSMQAPQPPQPSPYAYNQMAQMQSPQPPQYGDASQYGQPPVPVPFKPKKSKVPMIFGIAAVVIAVIAALVLLMKPVIVRIINPESQVKTALKASSGQLVTVFNDAVSGNNMPKTAIISGKQEFTYQFKLDRATVNGSDFLKQLKADTLNINMQISPTDKVIAGTMGLAIGGSSKSEIEADFYMDSRNVYMGVPALCSRAFYMDTDDVFDEIGIDYDLLFSYMGGSSSINSMLGSSSMDMYSGVIEAVIKDVFAAIDTLIEDVSYKKIGKVTLNGAQGDVKATQFAITITEQNVKDFAVNVIDNIYNDDSLKAMLGLLMTGSGFNINSLQKEINKTNLGFDKIILKAAVNNKNQLVSFSFDTDLIAGYRDERIAVELKFLGKKDIYDCVGISAVIDDNEVEMMVSEDGDNIKLQMGIKPNQLDYPGEYLELVMDMTMDSSDPNNGKAKINEYSIKGKLDDEVIDVAISGSFGYKSISSISKKKSDFPRPVNPDKMTNSEEIEIASEVIKNISVLKNVLSDDLYNTLYRQLVA